MTSTLLHISLAWFIVGFGIICFSDVDGHPFEYYNYTVKKSLFLLVVQGPLGWLAVEVLIALLHTLCGIKPTYYRFARWAGM